MRAILLAGGQGTRLRPLTLHTPKPIVPIFDRPFLRYQIDMLRQVPEIDEIVLSLNYKPGQIEDVFGDGSDLGIRLRYVVEPTPLGTGGAIKYAAGDANDGHNGPIVVFNGDVFTSVDLRSVIALHRERAARATIVLTPVEDPYAYGLVHTDARGNVLEFLEKPSPGQPLPCNTINAGIYVLEPETLDRIPKDTAFSIERGYFPSLVKNQETFIAVVNHAYWLDIGTPDTYRQAHVDIMDGRFVAPPFESGADRRCISPTARIEDGVTIEGPCFIDRDVTIKKGARIGAYSVIGHDCQIGEGAVVNGAILWPYTRVDREARLGALMCADHCHFGRNVSVDNGVFGDKSVMTDYSTT